MDKIKTLGEFIRDLRQERDLSLRELAAKLDVSAAFMSDIELGRRHPSDDTLSDIARLLGATVESLRKHDTRPPVEEIRKRSIADPRYGYAFRTLVDKNLSPEELLRLADKASRRRSNK